MGRLTCDRSLEIIERTQGFCRVATQGVNDFLEGQAYITAQMSAAGNMHFEFIKVTGLSRLIGSFGEKGSTLMID